MANRKQLREKFSEKLVASNMGSDYVKQDPFLSKLVELIKENIDSSDLNITMLYNSLGMSRSQFFRKVKSISASSPNKIILDIKMNLAAEMLRTENLNISEVAYKTGFSDPAYFSKVFRSVYNVSPTEYQKNHE